MLFHRMQRQPSTKTALCQRPVSAAITMTAQSFIDPYQINVLKSKYLNNKQSG